MRIKLLTFVLTFVPCALTSWADVSFGYQYDAAGNRISRQVITEPQNRLITPHSFVRVYPTITTGDVTIENQHEAEWNNAIFYITGSQGNEVMCGTLNGYTHNVTLPIDKGIYILYVIDGENVDSFKLIKQ